MIEFIREVLSVLILFIIIFGMAILVDEIFKDRIDF